MKLKSAYTTILLLFSTVGVVFSQNISSSSAQPQSISNYNPEMDSNNLMLIDATLELNEAMLAGVKASLDTLQKPEPAIKNNNDVKEILKRMKRAKDRIQLIPYLQRVNDSLTLDNRRLHVQKQDILSRLTPYLEYLKYQDSVLLAKNKPAPVTATASTVTTKSKTKKELTSDKNSAQVLAQQKTEPTEAKKQKNTATIFDTVIVFDTNKPVASKGDKQKKPSAAKEKDEQKPAKTANRKKHDEANSRDHTNSFDTIVIIDAPLDLTPAPPVASVTPKVNNKKTSEKDTPEKDKKKKKENETENKINNNTEVAGHTDTRPAYMPAISNADSIRKIKSQFFLARAQKAIMEKKDKQAQEYLQKSIELWHNNYDAWLTLAKQDGLNGSFTKALSEYNECARIDSMQPKLYYDIGTLYLNNKKKTEAVQYFTEAIQIDPDYILAYMERAAIYKDWKQYDAAINDYNSVLAKNVNYHFAYKARGIVKQLNRKFSEAVDDFTRYLLFEETDPSAYYYRGLSKIGNNELLDGCMDLSKAAEMGYTAADRAIKMSCE